MRTKTYTKNAHGINIAKCCASCKFNSGVSDKACTRRICQQGEGGGKVKKKAYIDFVNNNITRWSLSDIRAEFEKKHGSIFM